MDKMVWVKWIDSGGTSRWIDLPAAEKDEYCLVETVGYLVKEDDERITVAQSFDKANNTVNALLTVPKVAVQEVKFLRFK